MKKQLFALLKREIDPLHFVLICLVLVSVVVTAKVLTDQALTTGDYAFEESEMYLPAL